MQVLLTTTGNSQTVILDDLDGRTFTHPSSNVNLLEEFSLDDIAQSDSLQNAINADDITLNDEDGNTITSVSVHLAPLSEIKKNSPIWNAGAINGILTDLSGIDTTKVLGYDGTKVVPVPNQGGGDVFGANRQYAESIKESRTNSRYPLWVSKLKMVTPSIPAGTYIIKWQYFWSASRVYRDFRGRVTVDGTDMMYHSQEAKEAGIDNKVPASGFDFWTFTSEASHTIKIDYCSEHRGMTVYIEDARLAIWRWE